MRKSTKVAMLVVAIALLASLTVFAKGWKQDEIGWYYEDAYDMMEYLKWEKSGENYYYLGEDGYMVTNALVQDSNGAKYWVGADGAKVTNTWVQVPADDYDIETYDVEYRWYRFGATGKAVTSTWTSPEGKKYFFDTDGKMLFGYHDGTQIISTSTPFNASVYFSGSNDDGAMVKDIWYRIDVTDAEAYDEDTFKWVYYKAGGKKADAANTGNGLVWKGQRYYFDPDGRMLYSYNAVSESAATNSATKPVYLSTSDDGHMVKRSWVYTTPELDSDADKRWYYYDAAGRAVSEAKVKKINGKYYAFAKGAEDNNAYRMLYAFVEMMNINEKDAITAGDVVGKIDTTKITVDEWKSGKYALVYYFSGDEVNDGSLKKSITVNNVEFYDDYANIVIDKTGKVANGLYNSRYYQNGILLAPAAEDRYGVFYVGDADGKPVYKLLATSGTAVKSGVAIDGDGNYYVVKKDVIYKVGNYLDYAVRAAQAVNAGKTTFVADGDTYTVDTSATPVKGVIDVTYTLSK